jgi:uncharacterized protein YmfQ (DUF2313 family)
MPKVAKMLRSLFPKGLVFRFFNNSTFRLFVEALAEEPLRVKTYSEGVRNGGIPGLLPDDVLSDWETFLALPYDSSLTVEERQSRIVGKYTAMGGQSVQYLQEVMQMAGFPVYGFENVPIHINPTTITGHLIAGPPGWYSYKTYLAALGGFQLGEYQLAEYSGTIVREIEAEIPEIFSQYIFIWFLCGSAGIGDFVDIPAARETDFKRLIESVKPAHTWVIAQVNFIAES